MEACGTPCRGLLCRYTQYARSKLCNVLHVLELQRRLSTDERRIASYAVSPGRVRTQIFDNLPPVARAVLNPLARALFQTPKQVGCCAASPALTVHPIATRKVITQSQSQQCKDLLAILLTEPSFPNP